MTHLDHTPHAPRGSLAAVLFAGAALLLIAGLLGGGVDPSAFGTNELAAPATPTDMPDWRGNSAHIPSAR